MAIVELNDPLVLAAGEEVDRGADEEDADGEDEQVRRATELEQEHLLEELDH